MEISVEEGRVLGCLVEKERTTPQLYPLSDNALLAACNQSTSRDPVVQYDVSTVRLAVRSLRERELVRTVHRSGERSDKHLHLLGDALGLTPAGSALLAVLLLRGPQTLAELRARTERLHTFADTAQVEQSLGGLVHRDPPLAARLERQPGRKEDRYAELLVTGAAAVVTTPSAVEPGAALVTGPSAVEPGTAAVTGPSAVLPGASAATPAAEPAPPTLAGLAEQVVALQSEVAALRAELDRRLR